MLSKLKRSKVEKSDQGFTIIEVMIVLAIAGLILLIVFLAVPALQRSSRNTSRKNDIGRISSAINDWESNNNGTTLTAGAGTALSNLTTIINDAGTLSQYTLVAASAIGANSLNLVSGAKSAMPAGTSNVNLGSVQIDTGANCGTNGATVASSSTRSIALQYLVETSSAPTPICLNVQ